MAFNANGALRNVHQSSAIWSVHSRSTLRDEAVMLCVSVMFYDAARLSWIFFELS